MSELREYLEFIRPWSDQSHKVVVSEWDAPKADGGHEKRKLQRGAIEIDDVEAMIRYYDNKKENVWFSTQTFEKSPKAVALGQGGKWFKDVNRKQQYIQAIHNFWCDLDVKPEAYASLQDAVDAIYAFCGKLQMPPPSIMVCSGYGLHCYWRIEEEMTLHQWQPVAAALRHAMMQEGILADHGCTIDSARILRPPGTRNWKDPANPVVTYTLPGCTKQVYKLEWMTHALAPFTGPHIATIAGKHVGPPVGLSGVNANLAANVDMSMPVNLREVAQQCAVLEEEFLTAGAHASQPLWSLIALACAFDLTPWDTFEALSDGYASYDEALARQKLAEKELAKGKTGWPSCNAFSAVSTLCQSCPHFAAGKSPLHLKAKPQVAPGAIPGALPNLPPAYWQNADGTVWTNIRDKEGKPVPVQVSIWPISDGALDEETDELVFAAMLGKQARKIRIRAEKARNQDIRGELYKQGFYSQEYDAKKIGEFIVAWTTHLKTANATKMRSSKLGWDDDGNFTHGEITWIAGVSTPAVYRDKGAWLKYMPAGNAKPWHDAANFICGCGNPALETLLASAFAAPLVDVVAPGSVMLSPYSKRTSAGKTTSLRTAQAVWGHPIRAMFGLDDTPKSVDKAFGDVRHLPVIWDEIRTKDTLDAIVAQAFRLGQGKGRSRLHADSSSFEGATFKTMLVAASNYSLAELITAATNDSDAGAQRVFEVELPSYADDQLNPNVGYMINALETNYGHAGVEYAAFLSRNRVRIAKEVTDFNNALTAKLGASGGERFWVPLMSTIICGAKYANEIGLTKFNLSPMLQYLTQQLNKMRYYREREVRSMSKAETIEELMQAFLASGQVIFTTHLAGQNQQVALSNNQSIDDVKRIVDPIGQMATTQGIIRIALAPFNNWLKKRLQSPRQVKQILMDVHHAKETRSTIGAGIGGFGGMGMTKVYCLDVNLANVLAP